MLTISGDILAPLWRIVAMIFNAIAEKLKRQSTDDFKGRHFEARLHCSGRCLVLAPSAELSRFGGGVSRARLRSGYQHDQSMSPCLRADDRETAADGFGFTGDWTINDQNDLLAWLFDLAKVNTA